MYRCILVLIFFLTSSIMLAQDIDDLFDSPDETIEQEGKEGDKEALEESLDQLDQDEEKVDLAAVVQNDFPVVKGSTSLSGGFVAGIRDWDETFTLDSFSAYYTLGANIVFDIRPTSDFRFYSKFNVSLNSTTGQITGPSVDEIFVDYTLADTVLFRVGKQGIPGGQGLSWPTGIQRFNPGKIVDGSVLAIKASIPIGNGLTFVIYQDGTNTRLVDFGYAAFFDIALGPLSLGLSLRFKRTLPKHTLATDFYLKTEILGIDLAVETRVDFDTNPERNGNFSPRVELISNFFWESSVGIRLLGEYYFRYGPEVQIRTGSAEDETVHAERGEHFLNLGILLVDLLPNNWRPGLHWGHHFLNNSGQVVIGITGTVAPNLSANIAIPIVYGPDYGYYRRVNETGRVIGLAVGFTLSASF